MRLKVCGITNPEQLEQLNEMQIEFGGLIFYPNSPRYVFKHTTAQDIKKVKGNINKVGVFVNATEDYVLKSIDDCGLYLVQLHGDETPYYCEKISNYITVIKVFRIGQDENILWRIKDYVDVVDIFLFDTDGAGYGGTGKKFDWSVLSGLTINKPFFLSGGITPDDTENLKAFMQLPVAKNLFAFDINSKFEIVPGIKDMTKIDAFCKEMNLGKYRGF